MQSDGTRGLHFFDDDDITIGFDFVDALASTHKDLSALPTLKSIFICQEPNGECQENYFGFHNNLIVRYEDDGYKIKDKVLEVTNARFKASTLDQNSAMFGFSISKNGCTFSFESPSEETVNDWISALKKICILQNFHDEYKAVKMIGKGSFAKVYLVDAKVSGKSYAVKAFTKESVLASNKNNAKPSMINEIDIMRSLDHHHIIKLHEVFETDKSIYLVLELIQGRSLQDTLKKSSFKSEASDIKIFNMIRAILDSLAYCASKRVMHRDLKPDNILLDKNDKIKIVDFGLATFIDVPEYIFKKCGTPGYIAPEVFKYDQKNKATSYDDRCDVFSAGCIFYFMLFGQPFFEGTNASEILKNNRRAAIDFGSIHKIKEEQSNPKSKISKDALDLLLQLLEMDASKRISASEALNHAYFTPIPIGMHKTSTSKGFYAEALSKYNRNEISSPTARSPLRNGSGSPVHYSFMSGNSPDKMSPLLLPASANGNGNGRFTEKDSLYLDMGKPELNGKVDTLTNHSTNNSMLLMNRTDSNNNVGSNPNIISNFAKRGSLNEQKGKGQSKSFKYHNSIGNSQSFLKAAIFRNMQKNSEIAVGESQLDRRGSLDGHLSIDTSGGDRRRSSFMSPRNADEIKERHHSQSPERKTDSRMNDHSPFRFDSEAGEEGGNGYMIGLNTIPQKRYQPFAQKH